MKAPGRRGPTARVTHLQLFAHDPRATVAFHTKLFGCKPVRATRDHAYAEFRLGDVTLAIAALPAAQGKAARSTMSALVVVSIPDFDAHLRRARRAKFAIESLIAAPPGERSFTVRDPAGQLFELTERV